MNENIRSTGNDWEVDRSTDEANSRYADEQGKRLVRLDQIYEGRSFTLDGRVGRIIANTMIPVPVDGKLEVWFEYGQGWPETGEPRKSYPVDTIVQLGDSIAVPDTTVDIVVENRKINIHTSGLVDSQEFNDALSDIVIGELSVQNDIAAGDGRNSPLKWKDELYDVYVTPENWDIVKPELNPDVQSVPLIMGTAGELRTNWSQGTLQEQIEKIRERNVIPVADMMVQELYDRMKKDAELVEKQIWENYSKPPGNGFYDRLQPASPVESIQHEILYSTGNTLLEPSIVPDTYGTLEQIREDIAAILRDGTLSYTQALQQMQDVVDKMDITIAQGKFIADGTRE
jgi:hypothetical protein